MLSVIIQEYNISTFNKQFPYHNGLITCADEASYLRPPMNFIDIGEWKGDYPGVCKFSEKEKWIANSPDPDIILQLNQYL